MVLREIQNALDERKPVMPLRIENVPLSMGMRFYLARVQWLDALTRPIERHLSEIVGAVQEIVPPSEAPLPRAAPTATSLSAPVAATKGWRSSGKIRWTIAALACAALAGFGIYALRPRTASPPSKPAIMEANENAPSRGAAPGVTRDDVKPIRDAASSEREKARSAARTPETQPLLAALERDWQNAEALFGKGDYAGAKASYEAARRSTASLGSLESGRLALAARKAAKKRIAALEPHKADPVVALLLRNVEKLIEDGDRKLPDAPDEAAAMFKKAEQDAGAAMQALADAKQEPAKPAPAIPVEAKSEPAKPAATPQASTTFVNSIGATMVYIRPGTFTMGSPESEKDRDSDETQHAVTLTRGFHMSATEVTQAQWRAVMGDDPSPNKGDDLPVVSVSWDQSVEFCKKLSAKEGREYLLPTEAEWEYAARANCRFDYCDRAGRQTTLERVGWYSVNSGKRLHEVRELEPNAWGLYDMLGNAYEWCSDWYGRYGEQAQVDPQGPNGGDLRVLRGGSFWNLARWARAAFRYRFDPRYRDDDVDFRVVLPPAPE